MIVVDRASNISANNDKGTDARTYGAYYNVPRESGQVGVVYTLVYILLIQLNSINKYEKGNRQIK